MKRLKAGIIGTGFIGPAHVEALKRIGIAEVTALAGRTAESARVKADKYGITQIYDDWRKLVNSPDVEVIHICSPNNLHFEMAKEALSAGKHVVCEKPLTVELSQAKELVRLAEEKKLANAVNFNLRYYPLMRQLRTMVRDGGMGEVFAVHGSYLQDWLFFETDYNWRLEQGQSGKSRAVADIGSHWLDLIEFVTGNLITEVLADFRTFHKTRKKPLKTVETYSGKMLKPEDYAVVPINTEDYASVLLRFDNGAAGVLTVNQVAAGRKNRLSFELNASKRSAAWDSEQPNFLWLGRRDGNNEMLMKDPSLLHKDVLPFVDYPGGHNEAFPDSFKMLLRDVYTYIAGGMKGVPGFPGFRDGLRELILCDSIVESNKTGSWTKVESKGADI